MQRNCSSIDQGSVTLTNGRSYHRIVDMNHNTNDGNDQSTNERENNNIEAKEGMINVCFRKQEQPHPRTCHSGLVYQIYFGMTSTFMSS